jgi:hypothetical protein
MSNQILDGYAGYAVAAEKRMKELEFQVTRLRELCEELWYHRNAWLNSEANKPVFKQFVKRFKEEGVLSGQFK